MGATPAVQAASDEVQALIATLTPQQARDTVNRMLTQFMMTGAAGSAVPTQAIAALALVALKTGDRDASRYSEFHAVWGRYLDAQMSAGLNHG